MKQKRTTLKSFIKNFPTKSFKIEPDTLKNLDTLPYRELYKLSRNGGLRVTVLCVKDDSIYYTEKNTYLIRNGRTFYKKSFVESYIYIDSTTVNVNKCTVYAVLDFLKHTGIDWFKDIPNEILTRFIKCSSILKSIFVKTIYNEETFYKAIAKRIFKVNIGWRLMKLWCEKSPPVDLHDLYCFSKNFEKGVVRYLEVNGELRFDLQDMLIMAVELDQIIDFTWSEARIKEEHQKQIQIKEAEAIASKSVKEIYKPLNIPSNIRLLNTELDVFMEGKNMHHCLYSCYWNSIEAHQYIAFHMTSPEDCTFSIKLVDGNPKLEQCHTCRNGNVSPETRKEIENFVEKYKSELLERIGSEPEEYALVEDLPYNF